ncbi:hypothetical protein A3Q56_00403, partial [Intoshia linei]
MSTKTILDPVPKTQLKRKLGLFSGVCVIVGILIGSGIFISPVNMLVGTKNIGASLILWIVCGLISLIGSICFAELGCYFKESGALYIYIKNGCNDFWGFHVLWCTMIILYPATIATIAITASNNFIQLANIGCNQKPNHLAVILLSITIIGLVTSFNVISVRFSMFVQNFLTIVKVSILFVIIGIGFYNISIGKTQNLSTSFDGITTSISGDYVSALYNGLFAYAGWYSLNFMTEELINPYVNLRRSIYIALPFVTIIYFFTNFAYFTELSYEEMINSNAVAISFAYKFNKIFSYSIPFFVGCSTFGGLNGALLSVPRMCYVAGRKGDLPQIFSLVHSTNTPGFSVIFIGIVSCCFLFTESVDSLVVAFTFVESAAILICVMVLIHIRRNSKATTQIRESGALYVYIKNGCNDFWGFHVLWCTMIILYPATFATIAITASNNFIQLAYIGCNQKPNHFTVVLMSIAII